MNLLKQSINFTAINLLYKTSIHTVQYTVMYIRSLKMLLLTVMLAFGFLASTVDLCVDDQDTSAPISQSHNCCVQCNHVRTLGPASNYVVNLKSPTEMSLGYFSDASSFFQDPFLDGLYRPPIA